MFAGSYRHSLRLVRVAALGLLAPAISAYGQDLAGDPAERTLISFSIAPVSMPDEAGGLIKVVRTAETQDLRNGLVEDALNYSLGLQSTPVEGLKLDANLWRSQFDAAPLQSALPEPNLRSTDLTSALGLRMDNRPVRVFTLSTRSAHVRGFSRHRGPARAVNDNLPAETLKTSQSTQLTTPQSAKLTTPRFRSNLKLSWEFGNHTASAITRYFDSSRDLSELGMEEINDLVDNITTVDLEYGYRMAAGSNDRAVISFGIQNVFDRKTMQILNSATRILDQNGRVAYGRLKYQF